MSKSAYILAAVVMVAGASVVLLPTRAAAEDDVEAMRAQIQDQQNRIRHLESQVAERDAVAAALHADLLRTQEMHATDVENLLARVGDQAEQLDRLTAAAAETAAIRAELATCDAERRDVIDQLQAEQQRHAMDVVQLHEELNRVQERLEKGRLEQAQLHVGLEAFVQHVGAPAAAPLLAWAEEPAGIRPATLVEFVGRLGPAAREALPRLRELAAREGSEHADLRAAAERAIAGIEAD